MLNPTDLTQAILQALMRQGGVLTSKLAESLRIELPGPGGSRTSGVLSHVPNIAAHLPNTAASGRSWRDVVFRRWLIVTAAATTGQEVADHLEIRHLPTRIISRNLDQKFVNKICGKIVIKKEERTKKVGLSGQQYTPVDPLFRKVTIRCHDMFKTS